MDNNRTVLVFCALVLLLSAMQVFAMIQQEKSNHKLESGLLEIRQTLAEMRNRLPQFPPPTGADAMPGGVSPGPGGPPPQLGSRGDRGPEKTGAGNGQPHVFTDADASDRPRAQSSAATAGGGSSPGGMADVLARLIVLEYRADTSLTDGQTARIKQTLQQFRNHATDGRAVEAKVTGVLTPPQLTYLKQEETQVNTKRRELLEISGKDDYAYADLALEFLEKPIRPSSSGAK